MHIPQPEFLLYTMKNLLIFNWFRYTQRDIVVSKIQFIFHTWIPQNSTEETVTKEGAFIN